jgi:hypothetical protein
VHTFSEDHLAEVAASPPRPAAVNRPTFTSSPAVLTRAMKKRKAQSPADSAVIGQLDGAESSLPPSTSSKEQGPANPVEDGPPVVVSSPPSEAAVPDMLTWKMDRFHERVHLTKQDGCDRCLKMFK